MKIFVSPRFLKELEKLPQEIQKLAAEKQVIFAKDPFDRRLKTHKLHGSFKNFWSFSVDYEYRIIFGFHERGRVLFNSIGNHDIYD